MCCIIIQNLQERGGPIADVWMGQHDITLVWPPHRMPVTTRIITFLVGDPYKSSFTTVTVRWPYPRYNPKLSKVTKNATVS